MPPEPLVPRLLILDDDELMRDLLAALLSPEEYQLRFAASGEEALQLLAHDEAPAFMLTDLQMPGLEGEALAGKLRDALPPGALLIGMSGSQPSNTTLAALDGFLRKPFSAEDLATTVRSAQSRHVRPRDDASPQPTAQTVASHTATLPPLDETIFHSLAKSIPAPQLSQLYAMTLDDVAKRHARMEAALAAADISTLQREAHTVKGSCGFVGAAELQALAAHLETGTTPDTATLAEIPAASLRLRSMLKSKFPSA